MMDIEELLIKKLPEFYRWRQWVTNLTPICHWEDFSLSDDIACEQCKKNGMECDEKETAKFSVRNTVVHSFDLENYLMEYARHYQLARSCKCDFLHVDVLYKYFVLNELTCSIEKYVDPYTNSKGTQDGKREHARKQLNNVINLLIQVDDLKTFIATFSEKIGLFSWRIPSSQTNAAEKAMNLFMQPQQLVGNITIISEMNQGFKFVQQIYPYSFKFD